MAFAKYVVLVITLSLFVAKVECTHYYDTDQINDYIKETVSNMVAYLEMLYAKADLMYERCEIPGRSPFEEDDKTINYDFDRLINFNMKRCQYRDRLLYEIFYRWYTGHGCYSFTQTSLFKPNVPKATIGWCRHNASIEMLVPCFVLPKLNGTACYPIDSSIPEVVKEIERMMASSTAVNRWIKCTQSAMDCCKYVMNDENVRPNPERCPAVWDGWKCWDPQYAGNVSESVCPEFAYSNEGPSCNYFGQKTCYADGTWNVYTDYAPCAYSASLLSRLNLHVGFLSAVVGICTPAIIIMFVYKRLRVHRLALHRNLLIAIVLRSAFVIITKSVIITDELTFSSNKTANTTIMEDNYFPCKMLAVFEKTAASAVFTCMLVDGVFMHRRIVGIFKKELHIPTIYAIAAVITLIPIIIWATIMAIYNDNYCWLVYNIPYIQWTLDGPRLLMLCINTVLLIDIVRIIVTKMNRKENAQQLSTAKATIFLMPVFGVQFLFTAWRPHFDSCYWEHWYYTFIYLLESLQGILVAMFYCYANKEVHRLVMATYQKTGTAVSNRLHSSASAAKRATRTNLAFRRGTMSTMVYQPDMCSPSQERFSRVEEPSSMPSIRSSDNILRDFEVDNGNALSIFGSRYYSPDDDGLVNVDFENDKGGGVQEHY